MKRYVYPWLAVFLLTGCDPCSTSKDVRSRILYDNPGSVSKIFTLALEATAPKHHLSRPENRAVWTAACDKMRTHLGELLLYSSFSYDLSQQIKNWSKCRVNGGQLCPAVAREAQVYSDSHRIGTLLANRLAEFCEKATAPKRGYLGDDELWLEGHRLRNQPLDLAHGAVSIWGAVYELDQNTIPVSCGPRAYHEKPIVIGRDCP